jgi:DNA-binding CsgD family transcriptional regulator
MRAPTVICAEWLDLSVSLSRTPVAAFPRAALVDELSATFDGMVSWNWLDADGSYGFEMRDPIPGFPTDEEAAHWVIEGLPSHPVLRWYALTRHTSPMSAGRVPRSIALNGADVLRDFLAHHGLDQQLLIPYRMGHGAQRAFVLSRTGEDFPDEQLEVARWIQPLIAMLDRQASVVARAGDDDLAALNLSGRELAVLQLLREGLTAAAIGHRLLISPRTVHTHLSHIYRKLGVCDRMQAVLAAQEAGLLPAAATGEEATPLQELSRWESPIKLGQTFPGPERYPAGSTAAMSSRRRPSSPAPRAASRRPS